MKKNWLLAICFLFLSTTLISLFAEPAEKKESQALYVAKDYSSLLGMPGFSDKALQTHFKLYQGYVANTNLLYKTLTALPLLVKIRSS
jgi:Fe-Mn family superoxide dismutase